MGKKIVSRPKDISSNQMFFPANMPL
jgi:hypothetical protein